MSGVTERPGADSALLAGTGISGAVRHPAVGVESFDRLRFFPDDGTIRLDGVRMGVVSGALVGEMRALLVAALGEDGTRELFHGLGESWGRREALTLDPVLRAGRLEDACTAGFARVASWGIFRPRLESLDFKGPGESPRVTVSWMDSLEVDAQVGTYGLSSDPACWLQGGYLSGFLGVLVGRPMAFREVACRAMGAPLCRAVGGLSGPGVAGVVGGREELHPRRPDAIGLNGLVGRSAAFTLALDLLTKVAVADTTVLFLGETGVGKEVFAQALHRASRRAGRPFVAVNCAAIPENLIEAELFGVEKGAFTGANVSRPGRFERADGGTLFLDEVGTLGLGAQGKLLRALQEGEVERVGDVRARTVDVRVIAATNIDLKRAARDGGFREDLWYRLSPFPIRIPPLRDRREDIPPLVEHFLEKYAKVLGKPLVGLTSRAVDALFLHPFPGNIRELENRIERAAILVPDGGPIDLCHLFEEGEEPEGRILALGPDGRPASPTEEGLVDGGRAFGAEGEDPDDRLVAEAVDREIPLHVIEARMIRAAVARAGGNLSEAARHLGMTRPQLAYRYRKILDEAGGRARAGAV
ncbi:MAG: sigma 54-interacting transcriptional regulator [Rhodospirillum sp.]|nr:sigma 54-interacting transcriptional regulator [Rhodospirillum sp.]